MASETEPLIKPEGSQAKARDCCGGGSFFKEPCCEGPEAKNGTERDVYWDNWKGIAIFCVFWMHTGSFVSVMASSDGVSWTYYHSIAGRLTTGFMSFIVILTMPSFCFMTGYFSTATPGRRQIASQIRYSLAWFIFHSLAFGKGAYQLYEQNQRTWHAHHPDVEQTNAELKANGHPALKPPGFMPVPFFQTLGADWYLWSVIIWRCVLPLIAALNRPLLVSFCISFFFLMTDAFSCTYSNAPFGFLPFFVAGFLFKDIARERQAQFQAWRQNTTAKAAFATVFLAMMMLFQYTLEPCVHIYHGMACLYGGQLAFGTSHGAADTDTWVMANISEAMNGNALNPPASTFCQSPAGAVYIVSFWAAAFALIFLVMAVIPSGELPVLTRAGANSLYIYLAHVYFAFYPVLGVAVAVVHYRVELDPTIALLVVVVLVVFLFVCQAQQWLKCLCQPIIEPDVETCCLARNKDESTA